MAKNPVSLLHATHGELKTNRPNLAVLPWGATEAHNQHLPYGTDAIQAERFSLHAAELAAGRGAKVIVLPTIAFGNNAQQQDQVASIHLSTTTAFALLRDVTLSLKRQGIDRLVLLNAHGGNDFKPMIRDLMLETGSFIALVHFWQMCPEKINAIYGDPGDHAGILETSLLLHWHPEDVKLPLAGPGARKPFNVGALEQKGVWTPRPWTQIHPDLGSGNPAGATAEKGKQTFDLISKAIADLLVEVSAAKELP